MPYGTGVETLQTIPAQPFVMDPSAFFSMTRRNVFSPVAIPAPGPGSFTTRQLPQTGIISKLQVTFVGEVITAAANAPTPGDEWPYNLLRALTLSANGQNDLVSVDGCDLHALRFMRYPAYLESVDTFPGAVGGGAALALGTTTPMHLTWEVPIAMDDTSLVGSLYAQSSATNLSLRLGQAAMSDLFTANPGSVTINGTFHVLVTLFEIPFSQDGRQVIPDLTRLHAINAVEVPFTSIGEVRAPLIRSAGQLARLTLSARSSATNRLSANPAAAAGRKIDSLRVEYGGNQRPLTWNPASALAALNNQHYGRPIPYDRLAIDLVKENPPRDVILMQGVTELATVLGVGAGVDVTAGKVRLVQETLF